MYTCTKCKEGFHYSDEVVHLLEGEPVTVDQYNHKVVECVCNTCHYIKADKIPLSVLLGGKRYESECDRCGNIDRLTERETKQTVFCQRCYNAYSYKAPKIEKEAVTSDAP